MADLPVVRTRLSKIEDWPAFLEACRQEHLKRREPDAPTFSRHQPSEILLGMDLPGGLLAVNCESLLAEDLLHGVDHERIAAEKDMGVAGRGLEAPGLIDHSLFPEILGETHVALPGHRLAFGAVDGWDIGEVRSKALEVEQLGAIAEIPGIPRSMEHEEFAWLIGFHVGSDHGHVGS